MRTTITLYNSSGETFDVEIEYWTERIPQGWFLADDVEITSAVILTELNGFVPYDIETVVEEQIKQFENNADIRLKCKVEFAERLRERRFKLMEKEPVMMFI